MCINHNFLRCSHSHKTCHQLVLAPDTGILGKQTNPLATNQTFVLQDLQLACWPYTNLQVSMFSYTANLKPTEA